MEERTAQKWYWWLWLSPLVVIPTLYVLSPLSGVFFQDVPASVGYRLAIGGSSLWHLILLVPVWNQKHEFVRWHGRQALLLAGLRTVGALAVVQAAQSSTDVTLTAFSVLIVIWFAGTLMGQTQAAHGKCSLMRWSGRAEAQPSRMRSEGSAQESEADALVEVIRFSYDPQERAKALSKLRELGMVESL